jgi:hypothetical protein
MYACLLLGNFFVDGDTAIWADNCTQGATGAIMCRINQNGRPISFAIQFFGQFKDIFRTGFPAKFAPFTALYVDNNTTFCHSISPL